MYVYNAAWLALAIVMTVVIGAGSVWAWRSRGFRPALFLLGLAMLPMAMYLTGTLRVLGVIADQVSGFVLGFAFSPKVWVGVILGAGGLALMGIASLLKRRGVGVRAGAGRAPRGASRGSGTSGQPHVSSGSSKGGSDDLDDIEAILRKHGIQ